MIHDRTASGITLVLVKPCRRWKKRSAGGERTHIEIHLRNVVLERDSHEKGEKARHPVADEVIEPHRRWKNRDVGEIYILLLMTS